MRVEVDLDRCEGFGMCEQAAPDALSAGDGQARARIDPVPPDLRPAIEQAVRACPRGALRLAD
jgi:ferredoxin